MPNQSIQELREERESLAIEVHNLVEDKPKDEAWTAKNDEDYNKLVASIGDIDSQIERKQKVLDLNAQRHQRAKNESDKRNISVDQVESEDEKGKATLAKWMRGGASAMSQDELQEMRERKSNPKNTMSTGTGSEGGYLTQNEFAPYLTEAMKYYGGMRNMATVIQTETGSQMDFPTSDATSEEGEIIAENGSVTSSDPSFGTKSINTYKYSSKVIAVPYELIQDGQIDVVGYVNGVAATRLGRHSERHFTVGDGSSKPNGLIPQATVGKVGSSQTAMSFDDLVDLEHSVDPAYRVNPACGFMFHDNTLRDLRKLKDSDNRPIWLPGLGLTEGAPATINGYRYEINQFMAAMAADALSASFGDHSKYIIREVMQVLLLRFDDSVYASKGQVGFLAFMRMGGNLVDVGGAVKTFQNASA